MPIVQDNIVLVKVASILMLNMGIGCFRGKGAPLSKDNIIFCLFCAYSWEGIRAYFEITHHN